MWLAEALTKAWDTVGNGATRSTKTCPVCAPLTLPMDTPGPLQPQIPVGLLRNLAGSRVMEVVPACSYWHHSQCSAHLVLHPGTWGIETVLFLGLLQIITLLLGSSSWKETLPRNSPHLIRLFLSVSALLSSYCPLQSQMKAHGAGCIRNSVGTGSSVRTPQILFKAGCQQLCNPGGCKGMY